MTDAQTTADGNNNADGSIRLANGNGTEADLPEWPLRAVTSEPSTLLSDWSKED